MLVIIKKHRTTLFSFKGHIAWHLDFIYFGGSFFRVR
jgi:hypothetical protein